jgi:hypothetical protein
MAANRDDQVLRAGVQALLDLDAASFEQLRAALAAAPPTVYRYQLVESVKVPGMSSDLLDLLLEFALLCTRLRFDGQETAEQFTNRLAGHLAPKGSEETLRVRMVALLQPASIRISTKARSVLRAAERVFDSARIISDVRPVFSEPPSLTIDAVVLAHSLIINYWEDGAKRAVHVSMDNDDVRSLREVLDRAELKVEVLRDYVPDGGPVLLEVESPQLLMTPASDE